MISIRDIIIAKSIEFEMRAAEGERLTIPQCVKEIFRDIKILGNVPVDKSPNNAKNPDNTQS